MPKTSKGYQVDDGKMPETVDELIKLLNEMDKAFKDNPPKKTTEKKDEKPNA